MIKYYWSAPHRLWAFAVVWPLRFDYSKTWATRAAAFGPFVIALTDLTWKAA